MQSVRNLRLTVLSDDEGNPSNPSLIPSHSLSILVELEKTDRRVERILFDTSCSARILRHNARELGVDLRAIDTVVVSLWRRCHAGGLVTGLLEELENAKVVVPPLKCEKCSERLAARGFLVPGYNIDRELGDGVYLFGPFGLYFREYVLLVRLERGYAALLGCTHYGIERLFEALEDAGVGKLIALVGGLNISALDLLTLERLIGELERRGVELVVPLHTTSRRAREEILKRIGELDIRCGVGLTVSIS